MEEDKSEKTVPVTALAVTWCVVVAASYYAFNMAYYAEKVSTFGRFFLNLMEM